MAALLLPLDGAPSQYILQPFSNPLDAFAQNATLSSPPRTIYRLVSTLNRNCFEDPIVIQDDRVKIKVHSPQTLFLFSILTSGGGGGLEVKNSLFCLDLMKDNCSEEALEEFSLLDTMQTLLSWVMDLDTKNSEWRALFPPSDIELFTNSTNALATSTPTPEQVRTREPTLPHIIPVVLTCSGADLPFCSHNF